MQLRSLTGALVLMLAATTFTVSATPARAETFVGSNIDSRVIVGLNTSADGVQALMPDGWTSIALPGGPLKGANMLFVLVDGVLDMDAEGNPLDPASRRAAALVGLARQNDGDEVRLYVLRLLTTTPERDPYGVSFAADIARTKSLSGPANGARISADEWLISPADGGEIVFALNYTTGKRSWSSAELFPYSAANPDFSRIYRYDQMVDLVVSTAVGKPASGDFSLTGTAPSLAAVLDGSQEIIAIMDVPVYVRKVYLP